MVFFWTGFGILVPIIAAIIFVLVNYLVDLWTGMQGYYEANIWPKILAGLLTAGVLWFVGIWLEKRPGRELLDPATGETVILGKKHTFFFIPFKWCAIAVIVIVVIACLKTPDPPPPSAHPVHAPQRPATGTISK